MGDALPEQMVDGGGEGSRPECARGDMVGDLVRTDKGDEGGLVDGGPVRSERSERSGADDNKDTSIVST